MIVQPIYVTEDGDDLTETPVQPITLTPAQWRELDPVAWAEQGAKQVSDQIH
ncbi:hypothetical protein [Humibacter sp.]|uniref:hypothetical protein n=1 Tax=Humibacter sp. TaxID=1940291 RepID=UPI003F8030AD